jgi:hypothetical protein
MARRSTRDEIEQKLAIPNSQRIFYLRHAFLENGMSIEDIYQHDRHRSLVSVIS